MDFICKENSPEAAKPPPSPTRAVKANANAKLSNLLNDPMDDVVHTNGSAMQPPPLKKTKTNAAVAVVTTQPVEPVADTTDAANGLSDNENSEDEQVEYAPWDDIDLNPAVEVLNKVIRESLEAGKTYNKSITAKTSQLISGCDNVLLELKNLADARDASRKQTGKQGGSGQDNDCSCGIAFSMLPLVGKTDPVLAASQTEAQKRNGKAAKVDEIAEDMTDRVLFKIEASMERLREIAELIQATSMQGEANLISKVTLNPGTIETLHTAIQSSAVTATAAAITQERGRSAASSTCGRLYSPLQVKKLQEWYYSYPRPLTDELTLMRTILNYRPYANPFILGGLTIAHVRDWFKRRRYRERLRYVKLAIEAGRDAASAEEEIDLRIEQRIEHLRATVDPNELVKELDKVRAESSMYDSMITSFARPEVVDSYVSASFTLPSFADRVGVQGGRAKRQRTQESDVDDAIIVKVGNAAEIRVLQNRIRSILEMSRSAINTNSLQQVIDILRSMDVSKDVRVETGLVGDLKKILKVYKKPTLLRKSTVALLESLGMSRRVIHDENAHDEEPSKSESVPSSESTQVKSENGLPSTPSSKSSRSKRETGKIQRPMKFSMKQVMQLESWFQQKYKPTQAEMEGYLDALNASPLRDEKHPMDVNMTQLRRWFNKRRCLRRPPFALMTQQDAAREGSKSAAALEAAAAMDMDDEDADSAMAHGSEDHSNDDSSDDHDSSDEEE